MSNSSCHNGKRGETLMLYAVLSQSIWGLLQIMLVDLFGYSDEFGNRIRVMLVAITMGYAIIYGFIQRPKRFFVAYILAALLLAATLLLFPENEEYLKNESIKLTLPLVLPSFLCMTCVTAFERIEEVFYKVSWVSFLLSLIYAYRLFSGQFVFSDYSMSLSFSLLLPTLVLYAHKNTISIAASVFLFILIVFMGSRSASIVIVAYVLLDVLYFAKKSFIPIALLSLLGIVFFSSIIVFFERYGVESRTLYFLFSDEGLIGHLSHRDEIYEVCFEKILQNPIIGVGLYGDRLFLYGSTSHNFFIEVLLDFGVFFGGIIIVLLIAYLIRTYIRLPLNIKEYYMRYLCAVMIPLMVSGSYLKDYNLGLFMGICFLLNRKRFNYRNV